MTRGIRMANQLDRDQIIRNFPEDIRDFSRRRFLKGMLGATAVAAVLPRWGFSGDAAPLKVLKKTTGALPLGDVGTERYWRLVKKQFMIRENLIMMNAANLCPAPYPVQQKIFELMRDIDRDPSYNNRGKYYEMLEISRNALADYLGASPDEIAITRNTSEGNNTVINGLTFHPGDQVVIWDENHPTANIAWDIRAKRYGFTVKHVRTPRAFTSAEDLVRVFSEAITSRTKILCFSHLSNISGILLPVKDICRVARERHVLTHVDGAQTFGALDVDLHDMGCDFYTGSAHKWFVGPKEVGVLYVRKERIDGLWPTIVGDGYRRAADRGARKFETLGQRDDARVAAMATAVEFHKAIGPQRIEQRMRNLASSLRGTLKKRLPRVVFKTPSASQLSGGVVVCRVPGADLSNALDLLYAEHNIGCAVFGGEIEGIRLCPHIYNTMEEIERVVDAVASLV
jgi:selenocysteine lyase/cysteine desulfurase